MWEIVPERLSEAMQQAGLNQTQLAEAVGLKQPSIGRLLNGETRTTRSLAEIADALAVAPAFLTGKADDPQPGQGLGEQRIAFRGKEPERDPDMVSIDHIDLRFGMGGTFLDSPVKVEKRQFSRAWLREFTRAAPENLFSTLGDGDSMEPTIRSGEVLLIDRGQSRVIRGDGIWAFALGEIAMVKRLRPMPDGTVQIHSDNPVVRPDVASEDELHVIGRVVAVVRRL